MPIRADLETSSQNEATTAARARALIFRAVGPLLDRFEGDLVAYDRNRFQERGMNALLLDPMMRIGGSVMIRSAFTLRLEPGALPLYKEHHDNIWPDLVSEIQRCGIGKMRAFIDDPVVFYYSEIRASDSWEQLWSTPTHVRWGELMKPLIAFTEDGKVDAHDLSEIFRLENSVASTKLRLAYSLRLEPGALPQYRKQHDEIWPELVEEMDRCGIARLTAFEADPMVYYYADLADADAFDRLFATEVHDRWAETFAGQIAFTDEGQVDVTFMDEIFHLETRVE
jgi:L-rhamnose mutarotase